MKEYIVNTPLRGQTKDGKAIAPGTKMDFDPKHNETVDLAACGAITLVPGQDEPKAPKK